MAGPAAVREYDAAVPRDPGLRMRPARKRPGAASRRRPRLPRAPTSDSTTAPASMSTMTARHTTMGTWSQCADRHLSADENQDQRHTGLEIHEFVHHAGQHEEQGPEPQNREHV